MPFGFVASGDSIGTAVGVVNDNTRAALAAASGHQHSSDGSACSAGYLQDGRRARQSTAVAWARFGCASAREIATAHDRRHSMAALEVAAGLVERSTWAAASMRVAGLASRRLQGLWRHSRAGSMPQQPHSGGVACFEYQRRAPAAQRRRQRAGSEAAPHHGHRGQADQRPSRRTRGDRQLVPALADGRISTYICR